MGSPRPTPDLGLLLSQASRAIDVEMTARLAPLGITPRGFCVLAKARPGDRTQGQIATLANLDKTTMVATLDQLEIAGLARRSPSSVDRRARIVTVTKAGERMLARGQAVVDDVFADVLGGMPGGNRTAFLQGLERLATKEGPPTAASAPRRRGPVAA